MPQSRLAKAVVLAAGAGKRMRRADPTSHLTHDQEHAAAAGHKALMPIGSGENGRPFLDFVLSAVADAGCDAVCLVIGEDHNDIQRHYELERPPARLRVEFARQHSPEGTAHALLTAEAFVGRDPFLVLNADNLYPAAVLGLLMALEGPGLVAFERDALIRDTGFPLARVAAFALLDVDEDGCLRGILEKPGVDRLEVAGPRALVSMNVWRFDERIFHACRTVARSARGELELPEAVGLAIAQGVMFRAVIGRGAILDLSNRSDVAQVTAELAGRHATP
ncbi:MAG: nucleotidyltransferase family protein [Vicinamibacterales bacterium]